MMSNLGMLGRVTISSLGDIIQPFQNSISWTAALKGLGTIPKSWIKKTDLAKKILDQK